MKTVSAARFGFLEGAGNAAIPPAKPWQRF
jgi:hypothetical protein